MPAGRLHSNAPVVAPRVMTDSTNPARYAPGTHPDLPPPRRTTGVVGWVHKNLLSSPLNIALTVLGVYVLYLVVPPMVDVDAPEVDLDGGVAHRVLGQDGGGGGGGLLGVHQGPG